MVKKTSAKLTESAISINGFMLSGSKLSPNPKLTTSLSSLGLTGSQSVKSLSTIYHLMDWILTVNNYLGWILQVAGFNCNAREPFISFISEIPVVKRVLLWWHTCQGHAGYLWEPHSKWGSREYPGYLDRYGVHMLTYAMITVPSITAGVPCPQIWPSLGATRFGLRMNQQPCNLTNSSAANFNTTILKTGHKDIVRTF